MNLSEIVEQLQLERQRAVAKYNERDTENREKIIDEIMADIEKMCEQRRMVKPLLNHAHLSIDDFRNHFGISSFDSYIDMFFLYDDRITYQRASWSGEFVLNREKFEKLSYERLCRAKVDVGNLLHRFDLLIGEKLEKYKSETADYLKWANQ